MIIGIGSDMVDIRRIDRVLVRHQARFVTRVFTERERAICERRKLCAACYAKRFAAKEACAKALGTGMTRGVRWRNLGVVNLATGKPTMVLDGAAKRYLAQMVPSGLTPFIHLTVTDDFPWAQAFVIIEATHFQNKEQQRR